MLKTTFVKGKHKKVHYSDKKDFDNQKFRHELELTMGQWEGTLMVLMTLKRSL